MDVARTLPHHDFPNVTFHHIQSSVFAVDFDFLCVLGVLPVQDFAFRLSWRSSMRRLVKKPDPPWRTPFIQPEHRFASIRTL